MDVHPPAGIARYHTTTMARRESLVVFCPTCAANVAAEIVSSYFVTSGDYGEETYRYSTLKCPSCSEPFLCRQLQIESSSEWSEAAYDVPTLLYPADTTRLGPSVPRPIAASYAEARACNHASAWTATAIMCRRTLEGLCSHHEADGRDLRRKLEYLRDQGVIERRLFDWADALRLAGNDAAHDVDETTTAEDARDLLEFTRAILEYVFTFSDAFLRFTERRERRAGPGREAGAG